VAIVEEIPQQTMVEIVQKDCQNPPLSHGYKVKGPERKDLRVKDKSSQMRKKVDQLLFAKGGRLDYYCLDHCFLAHFCSRWCLY